MDSLFLLIAKNIKQILKNAQNIIFKWKKRKITNEK